MARGAGDTALMEHLVNELPAGAVTQDHRGARRGKCCSRLNTGNCWERNTDKRGPGQGDDALLATAKTTLLLH